MLFVSGGDLFSRVIGCVSAFTLYHQPILTASLRLPTICTCPCMCLKPHARRRHGHQIFACTARRNLLPHRHEAGVPGRVRKSKQGSAARRQERASINPGWCVELGSSRVQHPVGPRGRLFRAFQQAQRLSEQTICVDMLQTNCRLVAQEQRGVPTHTHNLHNS